MLQSLFNRNLFKIIFLCFFSTTIFVNFWIGEILLVDKLMGFTPNRVSFTGVIGCHTQTWMTPVSNFARTAISLIIIITAFLLSKKASENRNTNLLFFSAFLFYPAANGWAYKILDWIICNPLLFIEKKDFFISKKVALFENLHNYHWTTFILGNMVSIFYLFLAYQIVFKHWNKTLRVQFFTFGIVASFLGKLFWFYFLGPMIYN